MIKSVTINLEVIESMLYYWSTVVDREKVNESFFVDVANMEAMKLVQSPEFTEESIRKVLSSIQNRELLSAATKPEKRFWSKNMWIAEDVSLATKMAQPVKVLNVDDLVEKLNEKYPDSNLEKITVHIAPLHLDPYYIAGDALLINFFTIYFDENDNAVVDGKPLKDYVFERLCELVEKN
ncbi:TDE2712 family protein [Peptostreptococcus sp. D1]|uniref:TDE2712 family protein n=1 Tax=Peptostreptococcus sp. D1 TaxID=72304 RepID=UPI0008E2AE27|nr:hypothetical protein [Peptostreptococcus sp. D1]SFE67991.1 hypothetical protein SAMN02910278_01439 [Peptostreptococcus sp. D1]